MITVQFEHAGKHYVATGEIRGNDQHDWWSDKEAVIESILEIDENGNKKDPTWITHYERGSCHAAASAALWGTDV